MKTKLTLNLDKSIIEKGRKIAKNGEKSLSKLVEDLLKEEIDKDTLANKKKIEKLHGMFGDRPEDTDWKEVIREAAAEKHG